ncbi:MAG: multiheme c-type cytochrome [Myxococcota bacterium]
MNDREALSKAPNDALVAGMKARTLAVYLVLAVAGGTTVAEAHNYLGAQRCENCHSFAYQTWARGPHAKAHQTLKGEQAQDPKCTTCHSMASVSEEGSKFVGVQCESCHGPGRYYYPEYVMRDSGLSRAVGLVEQNAAVCTRCHTAGSPTIEPFDYEKMWASIDHGKSAREAWEKRKSGSEKSERPPREPGVGEEQSASGR